MKDQSIRILMVEDSEDDTQLLIRNLKKGGYNTVYERVETAVAMKKTLQEKEWEVILCDYKMPRFSVPSAIDVLKSTKIDIPFIVVSGTIGEETAVECMRLGAHDYIMKSSLSRLCPAIARELEEAKVRNREKQVQEKLRKSEESYSKLVKSIPDIIVRTDLEGKVLFASDKTLKIGGYDLCAFKDRNMLEFIAPEDHEKAIRNMKLLLENKSYLCEYQLIAKDGRKIPFDVNSNVLLDEEGIPYGTVNVCRDIGERKRIENILQNNETRLKGITDNLPGIIFQFYAKDDDEYGVSYISEPQDEFSRILTDGGTKGPEELFPVFLSHMHQDDREIFLTSIETAVETQSRWYFEGRIVIEPGKIIWVQGMSSPTRLEDRIIFDGIILNVTERKLAEEKSRKSEEKFRDIFMTTPNCIAITRLCDGCLIDANKGFEDMLGWKRKQVMGIKSADWPHSFWVDPSARNLMTAELKEGRDVLHREIEFRRHDGTVRKGIYSARAIKIDDEECLVFILQDITERKLAEEKFFKIFMMTPDLVSISRMKDGVIIDINQRSEDIVGWNRERVIGERATEPPLNFWVNQSEREYMVSELKTGRDVLHREFEFRRNDGSIRTGIYSARAINIDNEECLIFIMQDVTDNKRMNAELQRSVESLRKAVGSTIQVLVSALESRDPYTAGHQHRSADLACAIAQEIGLPKDKIEGLRMAGVIHDIGKLSIPAEILTNPRKLMDVEMSLIKEHPRTGYEMVKDVESPWPLAEIIFQHHERMNGTGYPRKLKGDEILLEARILSVADVVEAMASHRPYRASLGIDSALEEIESNSGILYDDAVTSACLRLFREQGYTLA
jgi:PAS domain S-box-containing protein